MKISELAKKAKIPSKVLLIQIIKLGIPVNSAQSPLSAEALDKVLKMLVKKDPSLDIDTIKGPVSKTKITKKSVKAAKKATKTSAKKEKPETKKPAVGEKKVKPKKTTAVKRVAEKESEVEIKPSVEEKAVLSKALPVEIAEEVKPEGPPKKAIQVKFPITVKDLAQKMSVGSSMVIKTLMDIRIFATINQLLSEENAKKAAEKFNYELKALPTVEEEIIAMHKGEEEKEEELLPRPPVVTFMGHVDHGKTSLLDYIRKSRITDKETGGITQHIGAYEVAMDKGKITFLDTPGHEAFTAMRARGANATDIVVLVVAADDGIMPQTIEALDHARAANVPVVVAVNKVDKPNIDISRVKKQLSEEGLLTEDWGGKIIAVNVSAKTGEGVSKLLEMILLEAEMLELKANPNKAAKGVVIEAKVSKGGGPIATVLVQNGTLRQGDIVIAGSYFGKVRALIDDKIRRVREALPSMPVEILGLNGAPQAGDVFMVMEDEKKAKEICEARKQKIKEQEMVSGSQRITLEDLYSEIQKGKLKELNVILKADVRGSLGAIADSLNELSTKNITLNIIHKGIGDINESDILLAAASNAIVIGFHVRKTPEADAASKKERVDLRLYNIIYEAISDIKAAMEGLLEPDMKEIFMGRVAVKQVFKVSKVGIIAGSIVQKGKLIRNANCRLIRSGEEIYKGKISSIKRFKDDVREVAEGFECGISLENFKDIKAGDIIEAFTIEKIARRL